MIAIMMEETTREIETKAMSIQEMMLMMLVTDDMSRPTKSEIGRAHV